MEKYIIIGEKYYSRLNKSLQSLGFNTFSLPCNPHIDERLSSHIDLSLFMANDHLIFAAPYILNTDFPEYIYKLGYKTSFIDCFQDKKYPNDVQLNVCAFGKYFIYNPKTSCQDVIDILIQQGREGIECRQGYAKCSVCVVDEKSIITADSCIAAACRKAGLDVLEISPGYIKLDGFDYGFIGGAALNLSDSLIAFTGRLDAHPQCEEIISFIKFRKKEIMYLSDLAVFDIGNAIVVEKK